MWINISETNEPMPKEQVMRNTSFSTFFPTHICLDQPIIREKVVNRHNKIPETLEK